jgi:L-glutamine:2-deoxy-scyllo-inosose/3-amino-2,3-dideoxy-scyllo-inosose aminotransferase
VRDPGRTWPRWPAPAPAAQENLLAVLRSDRWSLTGPVSGTPLFERRFAAMFADYVGVRHCVPVDHGSSALVVALEALGLDFGDRVLVPALTWTASASAALRAGLVPVLVDVDPQSGCMSAADLDASVGARAAVVVHWSLAMADVPAIQAAADPLGISVIEDCAQAHGARWEGRAAGSQGRIGCFSMQQGKVLTCGEGGAVVTDDDDLAVLLEELHADSRRYRTGGARPGESVLVESASRLGVNFCLGEFQAAVLCAQLAELDSQHERRARNYALLREIIADVPGVALLRPPRAQSTMSLYELPILFDALPPGVTSEDVAADLTAELHRPFYLTDTPLHRSPLLRPWTKATLGPLAEDFRRLHEGRNYPHSDRFFDRAVVTHHSGLLGSEQDMYDIAAAVRKVVTAW